MQIKYRCPTCGQMINPRNFRRHRKACLREKRKRDRQHDREFVRQLAAREDSHLCRGCGGLSGAGSDYCASCEEGQR